MYTSGLGMWPDDACYDPSRPSWLPNWLNTFTEDNCVFTGEMPKAAVRAILDSNQNAGPALTAENRQKATEMAYGAYNELVNPHPDTDPLEPEPPSQKTDFMPVVLIIGAVALLSFMKN